jgi:hypothetical protein
VNCLEVAFVSIVRCFKIKPEEFVYIYIAVVYFQLLLLIICFC